MMMCRLIAGFLTLCGVAMSLSPAVAHAGKPTVPAAMWQAYLERFVEDGGRVVDDANGRISHSEGQGYGMLLAYEAGDRASFERIWGFTRTELMIRDDGLAAWRWDPVATPHITDINNASDGDLLIAYALAKAGTAWNEKGYLDAARKIARTLGAATVKRVGGQWLLMPGVTGFDAVSRPADGPVINLSYWIFEAFPVMAQLAPEVDWGSLSRDGLSLLDKAKFGSVGLPTDWISARSSTNPAPADGFQPVFGYNSLRISLYLLRAGLGDAKRLENYKRNWLVENAGTPSIVDVTSGRVLARLSEPGYRMLAASLACALDGTPLPDDLKRFEPTLYYPSTLYLLGLSLITEKYPRCL